MSYQIQRFSTPQAASEALARLLAERLSAGGRAVLGGGNTPLAAYQAFGRADILWNRVQLIASDERCLSAGHLERNDVQIAKAIGTTVLPYTLHSFQAELGPERSAEVSEGLVQSLLPFDVVTLGLGEDAHTASLWPHVDLGSERLVLPVHGAPKPPPERVSLSPKALSQTQLVVYLVTGASKREALARFLRGEEVPPSRIRAPEVLVFADEAAYPGRV
ncbi:6-phosphogluconolactonase [Calidithermus chliarophilus]|uniref:6-phosphogluconolactonase n=1 Tax=Calidithermus chliarophilus TaxID=52023 RepID=UPI0003F88373|nr:6-phosphogluconolactonase [Calidithermus chliarophilus]